MRILAIETSCDETSLAVVDVLGTKDAPRFRVLENLISSQIKLHRPFGGVVPMLAKREHEKNLPLLLVEIAKKVPLDSIDTVAVTVGPGLEPALWAGIEFARRLAKKLKRPLIGVNHLEGHLYSFLLSRHARAARFPAIALIVSGGHTILLSLRSLTERAKLGETRDDAAGEAFDKVARMLTLPYPGGPEVEKLARKGNKNAIPFPRPMLGAKNSDFSFSGLKTAVLYRLRDHKDKKADVAASFQEAVVDVLVKKTIAAARRKGARAVLLSGGVAANKALRARLKAAVEKENMAFFAPEGVLNTDNAAMIAAAAYISPKRYRIKAQRNLSI